MVLRIIFGPKRDEVTGEWRKLHSEELYNFFVPISLQSRSGHGLLFEVSLIVLITR
jgi:hypothetical protein